MLFFSHHQPPTDSKREPHTLYRPRDTLTSWPATETMPFRNAIGQGGWRLSRWNESVLNPPVSIDFWGSACFRCICAGLFFGLKKFWNAKVVYVRKCGMNLATPSKNAARLGGLEPAASSIDNSWSGGWSSHFQDGKKNWSVSWSYVPIMVGWYPSIHHDSSLFQLLYLLGFVHVSICFSSLK